MAIIIMSMIVVAFLMTCLLSIVFDTHPEHYKLNKFLSTMHKYLYNIKVLKYDKLDKKDTWMIRRGWFAYDYLYVNTNLIKVISNIDKEEYIDNRIQISLINNKLYNAEKTVKITWSEEC